MELPIYRTDPAGRGVVTFENDRSVFLGPHGDPGTMAELDRVIVSWFSSGRRFLEPATGAPAELPGAVPFDRLIDELRQIYAPGLAAKATWKKLAGVLAEVKALGVTSTGELTVPLVARYVSSRPPGQSSHTLLSLLSSLRAACSYAESCGYLRVSPFRVKKLSKWVRVTPPREHLHLSREEIRRILDRLRQDIDERAGWAQWRARRDYVVASIIAYGALRKNECLRLHVADVDLAERVIHIVPRTKLKTEASAAPVPIPEALQKIIAEEWLAHRLDGPPGVVVPDDCPWFIPTSDRKHAWLWGAPGARALDRFKDAAKRAGVDGATFQALRRSWATHAEYHGLGPALIQRVLRHTSERTSARWYRKADIPNLIEKCAGMDF